MVLTTPALPYGLVKVGDHYKAHGKCSTFGDLADVQNGQDNGIGATGYRTVDYPKSAYVSLPIPIWHALKLKGFERVTVQFKGRQVRGFLADKGPSVYTGRLVDCCPEILRLLGARTDDIVTVYVKPGEKVEHNEKISPAKLI
jgi:hypothetical protein